MLNQEDDDLDETPAEMAGSYSEIHFNTVFGMMKNTQNYEKMEIDEETEDEARKERPTSLIKTSNSLYDLEGTVEVDEKNMVQFVASDLEQKIKVSSPVAKEDSIASSSYKSGALPKQFMVPTNLPQLDSNVLNDIEIEAQYLASNVDNLTENLVNLLHSISSITSDNVELYKNSVIKLTDAMDSNIKSMYTIMAKTEEITKTMKKAEELAVRM